MSLCQSNFYQYIYFRPHIQQLDGHHTSLPPGECSPYFGIFYHHIVNSGDSSFSSVLCAQEKITSNESPGGSNAAAGSPTTVPPGGAAAGKVPVRPCSANDTYAGHRGQYANATRRPVCHSKSSDANYFPIYEMIVLKSTRIM